MTVERGNKMAPQHPSPAEKAHIERRRIYGKIRDGTPSTYLPMAIAMMKPMKHICGRVTARSDWSI